MDGSPNITDDTRISTVLPTVNFAPDERAKVIIMSHLGRPKGKVAPEMSLSPVVKRLTQLLGKDVRMLKVCIGEEIKRAVVELQFGDVPLLENLRFHPEETANDETFAKELAGFCDVYIDDAFVNAHRSHVSNVGITKFVPRESLYIPPPVLH